MPPLYRIVDWDVYYERHRTRELKQMIWVAIPTKMDGDGYTELVAHEDGAAHFGAWTAMVKLAARCTPRGTLQRTNGLPHDASSIARITRLPASVFEAVVPRVLAIGWLEDISDEKPNGAIPRDSAGIPRSSAGIPRDGVPTIQYSTVQNSTLASAEKPRRKRVPQRNDDHGRIVQYFDAAFKEKTGKKYHWTGKDFKLIKLLLDDITIDELLGYCKTFFEVEDDFVKQAGFSVGVFHGCINKLQQGSFGYIKPKTREELASDQAKKKWGDAGLPHQGSERG